MTPAAPGMTNDECLWSSKRSEVIRHLSSIAQQVVQAGGRAGLGVHGLDDDRCVSRIVRAVRALLGQAATDHDAAARHAPKEDLARVAMEDRGALADVDPH